MFRIRPLCLCIATLLLASGIAAAGELHALQAWSRATPPGTTVGVGYVTLHNMGKSAEVLVAASSPAAQQVEVHESRQGANGMSQMRPLEHLTVPAGEAVSFAPGGRHLMLVGLKAPLTAGQRVPVTLRFASGAEVSFELDVRPLSGEAPPVSGAANAHQHEGLNRP